MAIQYNNGYVKMITYEAVKKEPQIDCTSNSITFSGLEGFSYIRYVAGTYYTPTDVKAAGATIIRTAENGTVTIPGLSGAYSFHVQYNDTSSTVYNYTFG